MKAAFVKRGKKIQLRQIPVPNPTGNEVLLKIEACGVCGSDFIEATRWARDWKRFGHEIVGTVMQTGETATGFSAGDQVVVALSIPCGQCPSCVAGHPRKCRQLVVAEQGGFAEQLLIKDHRLLQKVAPPLPVGLAALAEPLTVILDALHLARCTANDTLLIVGGGSLGTLAVLTAKALNLPLLGVLSRQQHPRLQAALATTTGTLFYWKSIAGLTVGISRLLKQELQTLPGRLVVLHTAPLRCAAKYVNNLPFDSTLVNLGLTASRRQNSLSVDASRLTFKRIQLMSAFPVPCLHLEQAVGLLQQHPNLFALMSPRTIRLDQLPEQITPRSKSPGKILVIP